MLIMIVIKYKLKQKLYYICDLQIHTKKRKRIFSLYFSANLNP